MTGAQMSDYWREFRVEWRAVTSAMVGLGFGLIMSSYAIGIMGPHIIKEFGWSKSDLVAVQMLALATVIVFPFVGRLADVIGVRNTALIGVIASPLIFFGLSLMENFGTYAFLFGMQVIFLTATTPPIYCRIVVQHFKRAKGLALAIAAAGPSLLAALGGPLLNNFVVEHGWRAGYVALCIAAALGGALALLLMPKEKAAEPKAEKKKTAREDYAEIFRMRAFWLIMGSMLLCNLAGPIMLSQLNLVIAEHGVTGKDASIMVSSYAMGQLVGRFISGALLDRFPARLVAAGSLSLSAVGLFVMSTDNASIVVLALAVLAVGLSLGAESDIVGYLIARHFRFAIYSTVYGMTSSMVSVSATIGAGVLVAVLNSTGSYSPFMLITSISVLAGSALFLFLPKASETLEFYGEAEKAAGA
jgi:MFS family permease